MYDRNSTNANQLAIQKSLTSVNAGKASLYVNRKFLVLTDLKCQHMIIQNVILTTAERTFVIIMLIDGI